MVLVGLHGRPYSGSLESSPPSSPSPSLHMQGLCKDRMCLHQTLVCGSLPCHAQGLARWGAHCPSLWWPCGSHPPEEAVGGGAAIGDVVEEDLQLLVIVKVSSDDGADR